MATLPRESILIVSTLNSHLFLIDRMIDITEGSRYIDREEGEKLLMSSPSSTPMVHEYMSSTSGSFEMTAEGVL